MSRVARVVIPGLAHHVTQRGNRRMRVFFEPADYVRYRDTLAEHCRDAGVEVLAWCLMPNHVHLVLRPSDEQGLVRALAPAHQHYSWVINQRHGWRGYLWQGRFASFPMDEPHCIAAVRYVELNPVRAGLAAGAEDWAWSSARAHVADRGDQLIAPPPWPQPLDALGPWPEFLAETMDDDVLTRYRRHTATGLPLGSDGFVSRIADLCGRELKRRPRGRPRKSVEPQASAQ